jgi:hypothetical protein
LLLGVGSYSAGVNGWKKAILFFGRPSFFKNGCQKIYFYPYEETS